MGRQPRQYPCKQTRRVRTEPQLVLRHLFSPDTAAFSSIYPKTHSCRDDDAFQLVWRWGHSVLTNAPLRIFTYGHWSKTHGSHSGSLASVFWRPSGRFKYQSSSGGRKTRCSAWSASSEKLSNTFRSLADSSLSGIHSWSCRRRVLDAAVSSRPAHTAKMSGTPMGLEVNR